MKQQYKILQDEAKVSEWFKESQEMRIINLYGVEKKFYTMVVWDYFSLRAYLQFDNLNNCNYRDKIRTLHSTYISQKKMPKEKQDLHLQDGTGYFYVANEDAKSILTQMSMIFEDMLQSNCMDAVAIEDVEIPREIADLFKK